MKQATKMIVDKIPSLEKYVQSYDSLLARQQAINEIDDDLKETFIELIWFFEDPENNSFDITKIYKTLINDWLIFALKSIYVFFKKDLYLVKEPLESIILDDDYVDQSGASRMLKLNGHKSYTQNKIATYIYRGTFPKPDLIVANKKLWKVSTIKKFSNSI